LSKTYLTKSVKNVKIAFLYIMKHVKILSCKVTTLSSRVDYTERRKTKRKQRKISLFKIHLDLPQGEHPQREERLRKTFLVFNAEW
jgi:hypothetical protein